MTTLTAVKVTWFWGQQRRGGVFTTMIRSGSCIFRRRMEGWRVQSSPRPLRELFLALCCFFVLIRRSLSDFFLLRVRRVPREFDGGHEALQIVDTFGLFGRRLAGDSSVAGVDNGFVEPPVAAVGIVGLLATVVGLDDDGTGPLGDIARGPQLTVKGAGHVVQKGIEGHL